MAEFESSYQPLNTMDDEEEVETPPIENIIHLVPENSKNRWNHIENLDEFFGRVYQYHQRHGFWCMVLEDVLQLAQFAFVVFFSIFLIDCVNYSILFANVPLLHNATHHKKVTIPEVIIPLNQCMNRLNPIIFIFMFIAIVFWLLRFVKVIYNIFKYIEIRSFYTYALRISSSDFSNMTWHEVQQKLLEVQVEHQMCIHKRELTELDIYHRILRFKNYMLAMVNKSVLPIKYKVPILGEYVYLSHGLKYNIEMILFWGPWSPFENYWHLKKDYKIGHRRKDLAKFLSDRIFWIGIANLVLSPVIFFWTILFFFFHYADIIKREPSSLGARRWSHYARMDLRHFNELEHEFNARLSRGYRPAAKYMNIFLSPILVVLAKNVVFFAGSLLAVLVILTVIDEDTLAVEHVISAMTVLGVVVTICRSLIPDEHMVFCPEALMMSTLAQIHYMPDHWKGNAHTYKVRDEFAKLFQYKAVFILEELFSALVTPFIIIFYLRHHTLDIVDFFRNFTVEVQGVGDVCSFAQMDIRKHGHREWDDVEAVNKNQYHQAENGKTELSLMHFTLTNPEWKPPEDCSLFIKTVKDHVQRDASMLGVNPDNPLMTSLNTLSSHSGSGGGAHGYTSMMTSLQYPVMPSLLRSNHPDHSDRPLPLRGNVNRVEGPVGTTGGLMSPQQSSHHLNTSMTGSILPPRQNFEEGTLEFLSAEMSLSALYMHEIHHRRNSQSRNQSPEGSQSRLINPWHRAEGSSLPSIYEEGENTDRRENADRSPQPQDPRQNVGPIRLPINRSEIEMQEMPSLFDLPTPDPIITSDKPFA